MARACWLRKTSHECDQFLEGSEISRSTDNLASSPEAERYGTHSICIALSTAGSRP